MKIHALYVISEDGEFDSWDHRHKFKVLTGDQITKYWNTEEGKNSHFYFCDGVGIQVSESDMTPIKRDHNRASYLKRTKSLLTVISYEDNRQSVDLIEDTSEMEDRIADSILIEQMNSALDKLDESERQLIEALFYYPKPLSQKEYAEKKGISQSTVSRLFKKAKARLREILQIVNN